MQSEITLGYWIFQFELIDKEIKNIFKKLIFPKFISLLILKYTDQAFPLENQDYLYFSNI